MANGIPHIPWEVLEMLRGVAVAPRGPRPEDLGINGTVEQILSLPVEECKRALRASIRAKRVDAFVAALQNNVVEWDQEYLADILASENWKLLLGVAHLAETTGLKGNKYAHFFDWDTVLIGSALMGSLRGVRTALRHGAGAIYFAYFAAKERLQLVHHGAIPPPQLGVDRLRFEDIIAELSPRVSLTWLQPGILVPADGHDVEYDDE